MPTKNEIKVTIEKGRPDELFVTKLSGAESSEAKLEIQNAIDDVKFRQSMQRTLARGGRSNYIQICAPFELYALVKLLKPKHVIEVGVSAGISTAYLLRALEANGRGVLHSIDMSELENNQMTPNKRRRASWALPAGRKSGWAIPKSLKKDWDLRLGRSGDVLPELVRQVRRIDLFLYDVPYTIDGAKEDFGVVDRKLRKGSVALADNCPVPINWWARRRDSSKVYLRNNSGLRGFRVS